MGGKPILDGGSANDCLPLTEFEEDSADAVRKNSTGIRGWVKLGTLRISVITPIGLTASRAAEKPA